VDVGHPIGGGDIPSYIAVEEVSHNGPDRCRLCKHVQQIVWKGPLKTDVTIVVEHGLDIAVARHATREIREIDSSGDGQIERAPELGIDLQELVPPVALIPL